MERFFRSLSEWIPVTGYVSFSDAAHAITDYIVGYYSALRPHEYNGGLPQTNRKIDTGKTLTRWPVFVDHSSILERLKQAKGLSLPTLLFTLHRQIRIIDEDPLGEIISNVDGSIRLDKLFDGLTRGSRKGKVRSFGANILSLTDQELEQVLSGFPFRSLRGSDAKSYHLLDQWLDNLRSKFGLPFQWRCSNIAQSGTLSFCGSSSKPLRGRERIRSGF
jgi:hypothetical protein